MPNGLKVVIAFNLIATLLIWCFARLFGGGFTGDLLQPPDAAEPMKLVRIEAPTTPPGVTPDAAPAEAALPAAPVAADRPAPWTVHPDGSVRFDDAAR